MTDFMLPIAGEETERCDAARNRRLLLDAATELVATVGADAVTMDALAARAGVGKGTVFRRFGSRSGLMQALVDHTEKELQHGFLFGPPPLGPGADPIDRLVAFGRARLNLVEVQGEVMRAAENSPELRYSAPAHRVNYTHVLNLLRTAHVEGDLELLAYGLLTPLEATLVLHQFRDLGMSKQRLADGWEDLVRRATRQESSSTASAAR
ncbi:MULTISPECIES: helix-turn-helix domain-containing protein [unclassified Rhodococcus (in: high G+C Gram-positive bacteria)]|uniref:TetR/AcrR family transcriptional regulator n=1 Tax=unclassified Rhodococcus (in: high G+C Gram-positive bacteria) TaxID=192944 RepID=UPI0033947EEA